MCLVNYPNSNHLPFIYFPWNTHRFFVLTFKPSPLHSISNMDNPAFSLCSSWFICALAKPPYINTPGSGNRVSLLPEFHSTQPKIAPSNNNCLAVSFSEFHIPHFDSSLSLCRTFLCFLFFSLCFSTYSPQYCATLSYYFLAVGFNNELQFAWLGISSPRWITCLQILSPMGFRLHHCSSRFRILRRAHMSRRALLSWGSTHGESRLGGVACRDVRLYPRIGDDSRI